MREQLESERLRAAEVKQLLDNKFLKEAFEAMEQSTPKQMDEVTLRDSEMHTRLILARKTLSGIHRYLELIVQTGQLAELQLKEPNKLKSFFSR